MGGDRFLLENSTSTEASLGQYYIAFFGDPSAASAWEIQFGGHHFGINATLDGTADAVTFAPTHLGSQPAAYTAADGTRARPLAGMYGTAFAFYDSLDAEQQAALYQGTEVANPTCAPGGICGYPAGTGITGCWLTSSRTGPASRTGKPPPMPWQGSRRPLMRPTSAPGPRLQLVPEDHLSLA